MSVPGLNSTPMNSASAGVKAEVAFVSGPRNVMLISPPTFETTNPHWLCAIETNGLADSPRLRQTVLT